MNYKKIRKSSNEFNITLINTESGVVYDILGNVLNNYCSFFYSGEK